MENLKIFLSAVLFCCLSVLFSFRTFNALADGRIDELGNWAEFQLSFQSESQLTPPPNNGSSDGFSYPHNFCTPYALEKRGERLENSESGQFGCIRQLEVISLAGNYLFTIILMNSGKCFRFRL